MTYILCLLMDAWRSFFIVFICLSLVISGLAEDFKIYMVSAGTCGDVIFHLDHVTSYTVLWKGDNPGPLGCRYRFNAKPKTGSTRHVCVEVRDFFFETSGIYLSYFEVSNSNISKVYEKGSYPQKFCTSNTKDMELEVKTNFETPLQLRSHFTLHVYGQYSSKPDAIGMKIGFTVAGSFILLTVIAIIIKVKLYRRKPPPKHPISSLSTSFSPITTPSVSSSSSSSSSDKNNDSPSIQPELVLAVNSLDPRDSESSRSYPSTDTMLFNKDTEQLIV